MPVLETTTESHGTTQTTKWWTGLFTLQNIVLVGAAISAIVTFWNNQKNQSAHIDQHDKQIEQKADAADLNALIERVNRQYETNNRVQERIVAVEKQLEYQRGVRDGQAQSKDK